MNLKIYKRSQGKNSRLWTALAVFAVVVLGCWRLYEQLHGKGPWVETVIPVAVCAAFSALIYWLSNRPAVADFLIAAEGEIKKVSWSSRKEILNSTRIVIFVVVVMAAFLGAVDLSFHWIFDVVVGLY